MKKLKDILNEIKSAEGKLTEDLKRVTKQMWNKMDDDAKVNALLTAMSDPGQAEDAYELAWEDLPDEATQNMYLSESKLNEALPKFSSALEAYEWIMNKRNEAMDIEMDMLQITKDIIQTQKDMEQEASPEGGPTTDRYGAVLEKLQMEHEALRRQFAVIMAEIDEYDQN